MIHLIAGLPRCGSTLLCELLNQRPDAYASGTSGLPEIVRGIRDGWHQMAPHAAMPERQSYETLRRVLRAVMQHYPDPASGSVYFDKSRAWPNFIETYAAAFGRMPKLIVTVRDTAEIVASMELAHRRTIALNITTQQRNNAAAMRTLEQRAKLWIQADQPIGAAYNALKDAWNRGHRDIMHFVRFEDLASNPAGTLLGIYQFLEMDPFEHDFDNVRQTTREDDRPHGFTDLHTIRPNVKPIPPRADRVLGPAIAKQCRANEFWSQ